MNHSTNTIRRAEQILGYGITEVPGPREYIVVDNVIYTDIFEGDITIPGITSFKTAFNGRVNGMSYFNEIILPPSHRRHKSVEIDAPWGSKQFNEDIEGLLAWLDENKPSDYLEDAGVSSKKIEDFNISFRDASEKQSDINTILHDGYGFYVRRPLIISVASEQKHNERYF